MILNKKIFFGLFILASIAFWIENVDGQTDGLKWKLKQGDQFQATLVQTSSTKTQVDSRATEINSSTTIVFDWTVTDLDANGDATVEQSLTSIKLSVADPAVPDQAVNYDTASQDKPSKVSQSLLKQVMPLIGLKFDVVMSPLGEIKHVSIPDDTQKQLDQLPETLKLRNLFSKPGLKDILGAAAIVLPDEKLSDGQTWADAMETTTAFGRFNRKRTYTFVGTKTVNGKEMAEFTLVATLEPVSDESSTQPNGLNEGGKLIGFSGSGQLMLDVEGGFFSTSKIRNEAQTEKPYREKKIGTTVTNQIEMTVTRK